MPWAAACGCGSAGPRNPQRFPDSKLLTCLPRVVGARPPPPAGLFLSLPLRPLAALVADRYLYVFGGWDGQEELGDLHMFDMGE